MFNDNFLYTFVWFEIFRSNTNNTNNSHIIIWLQVVHAIICFQVTKNDFP